MSRGRPVPAADQIPDQDLRLVAPATRPTRAGDASGERFVGFAGLPLPEAGEPDEKPCSCQAEVVPVPLDCRNRVLDELTPGGDIHLVQPQLDGAEADTRPPLGDLVTGCRGIADDRCEYRLGGL